jgi:cyanophycinase
VFFTGGDQSRITDALVTQEGKPTAVLDAVWSVYRRGGVIAGTSAGAAVMSSTMFFEPPDVLSLLKSGIVKGRDISPGLGFVGTRVFIDQHVLARGRFARMVPAMRAAGFSFGIGVDENTALFVNAKGSAEVVGNSGVIVVDTSNAQFAKPDDGIEVYGVRLSYLERGDRIDLHTQQVTPSAFKLAGRVLDHKAPEFKPEFNEPRFYADVLGKNQLIEILCNLADNKVQKVVGLAFGAPDTQSPATGFEYTFGKGPSTLSHLRIENATAHYTVLNVEMDVRKITMAFPLYRAAPP